MRIKQRHVRETCTGYTSNAMVNRWVLSWRLNEGVSLTQRKLAGSAFHAEGPATEKARSPSFVRVLGTDCSSTSVRDDRLSWRQAELVDWDKPSIAGLRRSASTSRACIVSDIWQAASEAHEGLQWHDRVLRVRALVVLQRSGLAVTEPRN